MPIKRYKRKLANGEEKIYTYIVSGDGSRRQSLSARESENSLQIYRGKEFRRIVAALQANSSLLVVGEAILKRFSKNPFKHPTYLALMELGRVIKTIFLCQYLDSDSLKDSKTQVSIPEGTSVEISPPEVGFSINSPSEDSVSVIPSKTASSKIFFAPSVESEQFFSIYHL